MKTIEELLQNLARADVAEFAVASECLPCVSVNGTFKPVDRHATQTPEILEMLVACGGSRYVDSLGPKPTQWSVRIDRLGTVAVKAILRGDAVQARFVLTKRDPLAVPPAPARSSRSDDEDPPTLQVRAPAGAPGAGGARKESIRFELDPPARVDSANFIAAFPASADALVGAEPLFNLQAPPPAPRVDERNARPAQQRSGAGDFDFDLDGPSPLDALEIDLPPLADPAVGPQGGQGGTSQSRASFDFAPPAPPTDGAWPPPYAVSRQQAAPGTIESLLAQARSVRASDLHVVPERPILLRIAGDLVPRGQVIDEEFAHRIVQTIVPERLRAQLETEGSCDFALADAHGRCRVNVSRQRTGHKICLRLIPSQIPTLEALGLPPQIANATHHHQGLILVTGPTGHGKTSTLAAIVNIINSDTTHHVITVEDPIEFIHPRKKAMMSQREVGTSTKTFQAALKGSLREDPDVIVVGELRDTETVRMALSASETGHLVIGTMNTPSAAKTIDRLIDLFPPADQAQVRMTLAGGLRLIVSQRLVPNADHTRFVACAELLPGSISLWSLIRDNKTFQIPSLQQRGKGIGIIRIDDSLYDLVKAGRTTLEIAKEWAENPEELELAVQGKRPQMALPGSKSVGEGAKDAMAGILGKAGNLFRKGG